jgi:uncharacterized protein (TIGR00299 family) protein
MCLGALVDAGAPLEEIAKNLKRLHLRNYSIIGKKVKRSHFAATKVDVLIKGKSDGRTARRWEDVRKIIRSSSLPDEMKGKGEKIVRTLFEAEAAVHGVSLRRAHLHELAAGDCLVDIFGTLIGLDLLGIKTLYSSPLNLGGGTVAAAHGILPVPAPATAEILKGVPVYQSDEPFELTTPTGAAILKTLTERFGEMPLIVPHKIGTGAGSRDIRGRPNVLRIVVGDQYGEPRAECITVLETNIDDMNPQIYEYLAEKLLREGALDVFLTQVMMKKMRPGVKLSVLCNREKRNDLTEIILKETTSIGMRFYDVSRIAMAREFKEVRTRFGKVRIKISRAGGFLKAMPEYEDCKKIAGEKGVLLAEVIEEAKSAARKITQPD